MEESILTSTKKVLGIGPDDTSFDLDVITFINSAISNLQQIGIGPDDLMIEDATAEWADFEITKPKIINQVKTCVFLRARMLFDPPQTPFLIEAMKQQIAEHEARLSMMREETEWVDPDSPLADLSDEFDGVVSIVDGGDA